MAKASSVEAAGWAAAGWAAAGAAGTLAKHTVAGALVVSPTSQALIEHLGGLEALSRTGGDDLHRLGLVNEAIKLQDERILVQYRRLQRAASDRAIAQAGHRADGHAHRDAG